MPGFLLPPFRRASSAPHTLCVSHAPLCAIEKKDRDTRSPPFPPPPLPFCQDLAKTNLAFVSPRDPVVAYKYLEVNGL
jgi:hypothetical protein